MFDRKKKTFLVPLRRQLFLFVLFFSSCILVVTVCTYRLYTRLQMDLLQSNIRLYSSQLSLAVEEMYENMQNIARSLSYNHIVQNYLSSKDSVEKYENYNLAYNLLGSTMELSDYIRDIAVLGKEGNAIAVHGAFETYSSLDAQNQAYKESSLHSLGLVPINGRSCQILSMPIYDLDLAPSPLIGTIFLAVDIDTFFLKSTAYSEDYIAGYILEDSQGTKIYGDEAFYSLLPNQSRRAAYQMNIQKVSYTVNQYTLPIVGSNFYILTNNSRFLALGHRISRIQLLSMAFILLVMILLLFLIHRPLVRSLQKLAHFMRDISNSSYLNYQDGIQISQGKLGSLEIQKITDDFNSMLFHIYKLNCMIFENYTHMFEMDINNKKTEIAFLRSQVNPHFLSNTLTMICGMAAGGMRQEIIETSGALSSIFRYSIKGSDMVTLEEEMEIVRSYITIQSYRFEDRFSVVYNLAEGAGKCKIPKMIIQPLVENAIVHGLEPCTKQGILKIEADFNREKDYLAVWICDTGIGMSQEKRDSIRKSILEPVHPSDHTIMSYYEHMDSKHHDSLGILNVNSRMVLYYGIDYSLILDSEEGEGTSIQIRIPLNPQNTFDSRKKEI